MPPFSTLTRYVRRIHMYLALFLTPWVLMYALSSLAFNHGGLVREWFGGNLNQFETVEEIDYQADFSKVEPAEAAKQILLDLDRDGPHAVRSAPHGKGFMIIRQASWAVTRFLYQPENDKIVVEQQVANFPSMLIRMHLRNGYEQEYVAMDLWGLGVELMVFALLFWIVSGVWLWWTIKPARKWGGVFAIGGVGLFAALLFAI